MNSFPKLLLFLWAQLFMVNSSKPNVLLIISDDLRTSLSCYGDRNAYTPNIDKLASKSFLFTNAFAQIALSAPSRNSFLTSRRPDSLHLYNLFSSYWRTEVGNFTTLPQHFKENGYYTKSIGKVFFKSITSNHTDDYPYSWTVPAYHPPTLQFQTTYLCPSPLGNTYGSVICPVVLENQPMQTLPDIENKQEAIRFLSNWREETGGQPYFLALGFHKPHAPFKFPIGYLGYHPLDQITLPEYRKKSPLLPTVAWSTFVDYRLTDDAKEQNISYPFGIIPDEYLKRLIASYNAAVTYIDDMVGQVLEHVDENTIIVFTSDHGVSLGEHGELSKFSNFEVTTRVPLIIHSPSLRSDTQVTIPFNVELVDLFPTLVELTGVSEKLNTCSENSKEVLCTEGRSLLSSMVKAKNGTTFDSKPRAVFSQYARPVTHPLLANNQFEYDMPSLNRTNIMGYSMSTGRYRYSEWVAFDHRDCKPDWNVSYATELYDHFYDPNENYNRAEDTNFGKIIEDLREKLILGWRYA